MVLPQEEEEIFRISSSTEERGSKWKPASPRSGEREGKVKRSESITLKTSPRSQMVKNASMEALPSKKPLLSSKKKAHLSDNPAKGKKIFSLKQRVKMSNEVEVFDSKLSSTPVVTSNKSPNSILKGRKPAKTMFKVGADVMALCELDQSYHEGIVKGVSDLHVSIYFEEIPYEQGCGVFFFVVFF